MSDLRKLRELLGAILDAINAAAISITDDDFREDTYRKINKASALLAELDAKPEPPERCDCLYPSPATSDPGLCFKCLRAMRHEPEPPEDYQPGGRKYRACSPSPPKPAEPLPYDLCHAQDMIRELRAERDALKARVAALEKGEPE